MPESAPTAHAQPSTRVAVGLGAGRIELFDFDSASFALTHRHGFIAGEMPSFLAFESSTVVHCVNEESDQIASFCIEDDGRAQQLGRVACPGGPAHLNLDLRSGLAFAANYGNGTVCAFRIDPRHGLQPAHQTIDIGIYPHCCVIDPGGRFLYVPSKGSDMIAQFAIDASRQCVEPLAPTQVRTSADAGPRHLVFHPTAPFAYTSNEMGSSVDLWAHDRDSGQLKHVRQYSSLPQGTVVPDNTGSDIHVDPGGRYLYASNRGHDSIAVFAIAQRGGALRLLECVSTEGRVPRNFALDAGGHILLAANQESHDITCFCIDPDYGRISKRARVSLEDRPFWVGFWPR